MKEIREVCKKKETIDTPLIFVNRQISFYLTAFLTKFKANQVSIIGVLIGFLGSVFFLTGDPLMFVIGGVILYFHSLFDYCDGNIARYNGAYGSMGAFFDWSNCIPRPFVLLFLTIVIHPVLMLPGLLFISIYIWNHVFSGLRYSLSKLSIEGYNDLVQKKLTDTFSKTSSKYLFIIFKIIKSIFKKIKVTRANNINSGITFFFRRNNSIDQFPLMLIFAGAVDWYLGSGLYMSFLILVYIWLSNLFIIISEEG